MKNTLKRLVCLALVACMLLSAAFVLASCTPDPEPTPEDETIEIKEGDYTYKTWTTALGTNWNPHTWDTNADDSILGYLSSPFCTMEAKDTENGIYQWVFEMATAITDVTADHQSDLSKYSVTLPDGKKASEVTEGYVYEIKLNPNAKWQDGSVIDADDYIYSFKQLLNPNMKNYRANLYYSGESAVAGGFNYYYSLDDGFYVSLATKYTSIAAALEAGENVYIDVWGFWGAKGYVTADGADCPQWLSITDETLYSADGKGEDEFSGALLYQYYGSYLQVGAGYDAYVGVYEVNENKGATFDGVGLYAPDKYTLIYVCQTAIEYNYFLTSCTSTWLVHEGLYEANKKEEGGATITTYGTSVETSMSYGVYKLSTYEDQKQIVYTQNENWYGWQKTESGYLYSITPFEVDGKKHQQYQTTKIVIDVMTQEVAKEKFLKGEIMDYSPEASELTEYVLSDRLYKVPETYTMSFFFNSDLKTLQALDTEGTNKNSAVLSNYNFRKAMSYAINRADFVTVTQAWTPAYSLMNNLYHYDIYNDPNSSYRNSEEAKQAIVNLYGVEYGSGKTYATLDEAYKSINGFNITEAKVLMKKACEELVAAGVYTAGQPIEITIGWAKGALTADDQAQLAKINAYITAAIEGSGFGTVTFKAQGSIDDRYSDVPAGKFAIGYGAWGGAALYPFRNFQIYMDPEQYNVNELGCWDPTAETLTLTFKGDDGKDITDTMTWQKWSNSMIGTGKYANASNTVKLRITALLEEAYLKLYYRIPLAGTTICSLLSYQIDEYTQNYNIMYSFGGFRLMKYNYTDTEWAAYVEQQGGTLNYK